MCDFPEKMAWLAEQIAQLPTDEQNEARKVVIEELGLIPSLVLLDAAETPADLGLLDD